MTEAKLKLPEAAPVVQKVEKIPFLAFPLYNSHGLFYDHQELNRRAIDYYNKANLLDPKNVKTIVDRAKTKQKIVEAQSALDDAELALSLEPTNIDALLVKAGALYDMGEFEHSLMYYHRGYKNRKQPPTFEHGILTAAETDEDCIGRNVGLVLLEFRHVIKELEESRKRKQLRELRILKSVRSSKKESVMSEPAEKVIPLSREEIKENLRLEKCMAKKYLGRLAYDLTYLENFSKDSRAYTNHEGHAAQLLKLATDAHAMLEGRKETLRVRKPYYAMKFSDVTIGEAFKRRKKNILMKKIDETMEAATRLLERLRKQRADKMTKQFLEDADQAKDFLDNTSKKILPNKELFLDALYNLCGLVYLDLLEYPQSYTEVEIYRYMEFLLDIPRPRVFSSEDFTSFPKSKMLLDHRKLLQKFLDRLDKPGDDVLEYVWIQYQVCFHSFELNSKTDAIRVGLRKCLNDAKSLGNLAWSIVACFLLSKVEIRSGNRMEAKQIITEAIGYAKNLEKDTRGIVETLTMCTDVIEHADLEKAGDEIEHREKTILQMMADEKLRTQVQGLFRYMSNQPSTKRMSIVPGIRIQSKSQMSTLSDQAAKEKVPEEKTNRTVGFNK